MKHRPSRGFTIVEIAVVIAVISILFTIVIVGFNRAQAQARDEKRKADILLLASELEKYYNQNGTYPLRYTGLYTQYSDEIITDSITTPAQLRAILPGIPDSFGDPIHPANTRMFYRAGTQRKGEYTYFGGFYPSMEGGSGSTSYYLNGGMWVGYSPNFKDSNFSCAFTLSIYTGSVGSYILGYFSEIENKMILFKGINGALFNLSSSTDPDICKYTSS